MSKYLYIFIFLTILIRKLIFLWFIILFLSSIVIIKYYYIDFCIAYYTSFYYFIGITKQCVIFKIYHKFYNFLFYPGEKMIILELTRNCYPRGNLYKNIQKINILAKKYLKKFLYTKIWSKWFCYFLNILTTNSFH